MIRQWIINCLDFPLGDQVFVRAESLWNTELLSRVFCSREVARCDRSNFAPTAFLHSGNYFSRCDGCDTQHAPLHSVLIHCGTLSENDPLAARNKSAGSTIFHETRRRCRALLFIRGLPEYF